MTKKLLIPLIGWAINMSQFYIKQILKILITISWMAAVWILLWTYLFAEPTAAERAGDIFPLVFLVGGVGVVVVATS